jgi:hypothetical protein
LEAKPRSADINQKRIPRCARDDIVWRECARDDIFVVRARGIKFGESGLVMTFVESVIERIFVEGALLMTVFKLKDTVEGCCNAAHEQESMGGAVD